MSAKKKHEYVNSGAAVAEAVRLDKERREQAKSLSSMLSHFCGKKALECIQHVAVR